MLTALTIPLVYELVGQVRRWLQLPYVPIYFQFLPFEALNSDLSVYLGDDYFMGPSGGPSISKKEAERLKRRIQYTGALSIAIAALALPGVTAFVAAQCMPTSALWFAVCALSVAQLYRIRLLSETSGRMRLSQTDQRMCDFGWCMCCTWQSFYSCFTRRTPGRGHTWNGPTTSAWPATFSACSWVRS